MPALTLSLLCTLDASNAIANSPHLKSKLLIIIAVAVRIMLTITAKPKVMPTWVVYGGQGAVD